MGAKLLANTPYRCGASAAFRGTSKPTIDVAYSELRGHIGDHRFDLSIADYIAGTYNHYVLHARDDGMTAVAP
jgi:hypothetical protein